MYVPASFSETERGQLLDLCAQYPFATVITPTAGELWVSHLPLLARRRGDEVVLAGHVARANRHWQAMGEGAATTAIFHGPHAYVSPTWYVTTPAVPTWNYAVVHAIGPARASDDAAFATDVVRELAERFEGRGGAAWHPDRLPPEFLAKQVAAIVGFEISVERWEGKLKLGQNRSAPDRQGAIAALEAAGTDDARALAALMRATS